MVMDVWSVMLLLGLVFLLIGSSVWNRLFILDVIWEILVVVVFMIVFVVIVYVGVVFCGIGFVIVSGIFCENSMIMLCLDMSFLFFCGICIVGVGVIGFIVLVLLVFGISILDFRGFGVVIFGKFFFE